MLTPTVAVVGAVLGFVYWRTAEKKRRQELFDRCYAVFAAVRDFLLEVRESGTPSMIGFDKFIIATKGAEFIFGEDVCSFISEISDKAYNSREKSLRVISSPALPARDRLVELVSEENEWLMKQVNRLPAVFDPYLHLD